MQEEIFPLVDESGRVTGQATRNECHSGSKVLHPVVHLHVFNSQGDLLLQKRAENKDIQPGKWDTSVGGHVDFGESVEVALYREVREELGMEKFIPEFLQSYIFESDVEKELVYSYKTVYDGPFLFEKKEIDRIRFWSVSEIENNLGKSVFTPNFENEFRKIFLP
ncbi:MAG: NUDIX domain-containing protein [Dysgonamonadaceae bacterium]|jgi:isopentenyldiphosphate isomerase|nr:NUDIX domain-containing protein [Dysgonamonadaceae bacterium]